MDSKIIMRLLLLIFLLLFTNNFILDKIASVTETKADSYTNFVEEHSKQYSLLLIL
jgi:hypothetical protein